MEVLLDLLGNPHEDLKVIHIGGTNGKGSVSRFLDRVFCEAGYNPGLFTSPFVEEFYERIELRGQKISHEELKLFGDKVLGAVCAMKAEGFDPPTEFEIVTAIAFLYFKEKNAFPVILEVGLGGRGDSTNVVPKPIVAAITSIGFDHKDRLGNCISRIAAEKAGIIKENVPLVTAVKDGEAAEVIEKTARDRNAEIFKDISFEITSLGLYETCFKCNILGREYENMRISLAGVHQVANCCIALAVLEVIRNCGIETDLESVKSGIFKTRNIGRFEVVRKKPAIILDGAHNRDGTFVFANTVKTLVEKGDIDLKPYDGAGPTIVTGMLADKEIEIMVTNLMSVVNESTRVIVTEPDSDRKLPAEVLQREFKRHGISAEIKNIDEVTDIIASSKGTVMAAGSIHLIGDLRKRLRAAFDMGGYENDG